MEIIKKLAPKIIRMKVWWQRSNSYVSLANSSMLLFLFLSKLKDEGYINFEVVTWIIPLVLVGITILITAGYIDLEVLKIMSMEQKYNYSKIPQMAEIQDQLKIIENKLSSMEAKT